MSGAASTSTFDARCSVCGETVHVVEGLLRPHHCRIDLDEQREKYNQRGDYSEAGIQHDGLPYDCPLYCTKHNHEEMGG